jgi:hypothetical protein
MSETEEPLNPIDPPDNTGGGGQADSDLDSDAADLQPIDPPDNTKTGTKA